MATLRSMWITAACPCMPNASGKESDERMNKLLGCGVEFFCCFRVVVTVHQTASRRSASQEVALPALAP